MSHAGLASPIGAFGKHVAENELGPMGAAQMGPTKQPTKDPVSTQFRLLAGCSVHSHGN